jgi:hypothetical protein
MHVFYVWGKRLWYCLPDYLKGLQILGYPEKGVKANFYIKKSP